MNLRRVWAVILVNWRDFIRDKGGLFFTFAFPIILMLLFGFIFQDSGNVTYDLYIQDLDRTDMSSNLTRILGTNTSFDIKEVDAEKNISDVIDEGNVNFVLIIPQGYQQNLNDLRTGNTTKPISLKVLYDPSQNNWQVKLTILNSVLGYINKGLINATDMIVVEMDSIFSEDYGYIDFFIPGVIGLTVMTGSVFGTIFGDTELKKKGVFRKLSTTPITRGEWILSTMVFQLILAGFSAAVMLFVGGLVFGALFHFNIIAVLTVIFEAFGFTGLSMLVVKFVKDAQAAAALGNAITFPMMFLSGSFFDVSSMPGFLQVIAKMLPLYYVNEALRQAMIFNDTLEAARFMSVIAIFAVIVFLAGITLTSWKQD